MTNSRHRRPPEFFATQVRKVEPVGGDIVRLYFAVERGGAWDDQFTVMVPAATVPVTMDFVITATREIKAELPSGANLTIQ